MATDRPMKYPTMEQVEAADKLQLGRWVRFLPSPGTCAIGQDDKVFQKKLNSERLVLQAILKRFNDQGGWDPDLSKQVGL